ncbi:hypothetical protein ACVGWI_02225, partial [Enterobacter hormaechei]
YNTVQQIINESTEFAAVLKKRGITDPKKVITTPLTVCLFHRKDGLKHVSYTHHPAHDNNTNMLIVVFCLKYKRRAWTRRGVVLPLQLRLVRSVDYPEIRF